MRLTYMGTHMGNATKPHMGPIETATCIYNIIRKEIVEVKIKLVMHYKQENK